ncbi:uncharacterized protein BKCO1_8000013 [Diplodia corticola]|uniref:Uncharacterized protein n=1 Tax=Diplodia corticola TaxID=236234 RepID=A0A1J9RLR7_9PEZI|nr:uncharacterized protein BKCO1_8000013 [Diplodia corticola]OJD29455.1 hypothetical protein BKCO1_8000013 [Diplodia corticola]
MFRLSPSLLDWQLKYVDFYSFHLPRTQPQHPLARSLVVSPARMNFLNAISATARKAFQGVSTVASTVVKKISDASVNIRNSFNAFSATAPRKLRRFLLDAHCTLRYKIRQVLDWIKKHPYLTALIVLAIILAIVVPPVALHAAGFTATGVVAGSAAAAIQSSIGGAVAAGSLFAILTSAGMGGYGVAILVGCLLALYAGVAVGGISTYRSFHF